MSGCAHPDFEAHVEVSRLIASEAQPDVHAFHADITIRCAVCQAPFGWAGPPAGLSWSEPRCSVDALTLRAPLMSPSELRLAGPLAAAARGPMTFEASP